MLTPEPKKDWGATAISMVLAIGFASALLTPLWLAGERDPAESAGKILGESLSQPLLVTVRIDGLDQTRRYIVPAPTGTLAEALTRAAEAVDEKLIYVTRGSSIYLDEFMGLENGRRGQWTIYLSGRRLIDLAAIGLTQGELIIASWDRNDD